MWNEPIIQETQVTTISSAEVVIWIILQVLKESNSHLKIFTIEISFPICFPGENEKQKELILNRCNVI